MSLLMENTRDLTDCTYGSEKYYRFRADRWYGGIATADTVGCNLRCAFCWSARGIERPEKAGSLYSPAEVAEKLRLIASKKGFDQVRVSGGEPTIGIDHLVALLEEMEEKYRFILNLVFKPVNHIILFFCYSAVYTRHCKKYSVH